MSSIWKGEIHSTVWFSSWCEKWRHLLCNITDVQHDCQSLQCNQPQSQLWRPFHWSMALCCRNRKLSGKAIPVFNANGICSWIMFSLLFDVWLNSHLVVLFLAFQFNNKKLLSFSYSHVQLQAFLLPKFEAYIKYLMDHNEQWTCNLWVRAIHWIWYSGLYHGQTISMLTDFWKHKVLYENIFENNYQKLVFENHTQK